MNLGTKIRLANRTCSQDGHNLFGETLGSQRADRIEYLWKSTYDNRSAYDKMMGRGRSKDEVFCAKAKREGFTDEEIDAFYALC